MSFPVRSALAAAVLIAGLAGCATTTDVAGGGMRPSDLADCRVGGEPGPRSSNAPASARDRRCNPEQDVILWSNRDRDDSIRLDLKKSD